MRLKTFKSHFLLEDSNRFNALDSIRGLAALMVFFAHFNGFQAAENAGYNNVFYLFRWCGSSIGVDIFFVLSGYLIFTICNKSKIDPTTFIINRHRRLLLVNAFVLYLWLPTYSGYIGLFCFAAPVLLLLYRFQSTISETRQQQSYAFLNKVLLIFFCAMVIRQWDHTPIHAGLNYVLNVACFNFFFTDATALNHVQWALCLEYLFYYMFAGFMLLSRLDKLSYTFLVFVGILICMAPGALQIHGLSLHTLFRMIGFVFGLALGKLLSTYKQRHVSIDGIGVVMLCGVLPFILIFHSTPLTYPKLIPFIADIATVFIIWAAVTPQTLCARLLNHWCLRFMGRISFSFYLIHQLMINLSSSYIYYKWPSFIKLYLHLGLSIGSTIVFSSILFYCLERPYFLRRAHSASKSQMTETAQTS